ncbi:hypothetical protein IW140_002116 [Coemansia sp. RSA 1813]|nr:hypothetical protein EV178_001264 [Coemansia sp. RSA 1646]KAJ1772617.1 hypothetical protein LPJ74_001333 [Coemansia sp. RSA 1843]KAJ2091474.1 hypothetical protein IW138_001933 [Coemansia sp. RSA 986]KAJ2213865.1 hypothetical protein EV179_003449 [Coemansia sp. RSA 487]KAJ2570690.1 hypothetical protein IW140_002116 [Coemansia sp. RSA 1813]
MHILRLLSVPLATVLLVAGAPVPQAGPEEPTSVTTTQATTTSSSSSSSSATNTASSTSLSGEASPAPTSNGSDSTGSDSGRVSSTQIYYILALSACAAGFIGFVITLVLRRRRRRQQLMAAGASYGSNEGGGGGIFSHGAAQPRNPHHRAPYHEKIVLSEEQFNMLPQKLVEKGSLPTRQRSISASLSSSKEPKGDDGSDEKKHNSSAEEPESCIICLCEYAVGEKIVNLVPCNHMFHSECAFRWLTQKSTSCPLCKADMLEGLGLKRPKYVSDEAGHAANNAEAGPNVRVEAEPDALSANEQQHPENAQQEQEQMPVPPSPAHMRQGDSAESADHQQQRPSFVCARNE